MAAAQMPSWARMASGPPRCPVGEDLPDQCQGHQHAGVRMPGTGERALELGRGDSSTHEAQLAAYRDMTLPPPEEFGPGLAGERAAALAALTLDLVGRRSEGMYLEWLRSAIERVRGLPEASGDGPTA